MNWRKIPLIAVLAVVFCFEASGIALAMSSFGYNLPWTVASGGGIENRSSSNYILGDTVGQPSAIGPSQSSNYRLGGGFWYGLMPAEEEPEEEHGLAWYLHDDTIMYRGVTTNPAGTEPIGEGEEVIWLSDETALADCTFPGGTWQGQITIDETLDSGEQFIVTIGSSDGTSFNGASNGSQTFTGDSNQQIFILGITADSFPVRTDDYLALRIENPSGGSTGGFNVKTGLTNSYCEAPVTSPNYPLPEIASIALMGIGLAILGVYLWLRRCRHELVVR